MLGVTIAYVIINSKMHNEMVRERRKRERPIISLRLEQLNVGFFNLIIENISDIPIYNIVFENYPDFKILSNNLVNSVGFIEYGIRYLAPKQIYRSFFMQFVNNNKIWDEIIKFDLVFTNQNKDEFKEHIEINLSILKENYKLGMNYEEKIIKEFESLNKSINAFVKLKANDKN
jgi:hypothetical protein